MQRRSYSTYLLTLGVAAFIGLGAGACDKKSGEVNTPSVHAEADKTAGDKTAGDKTAGDKTAGDKAKGEADKAQGLADKAKGEADKAKGEARAQEQAPSKKQPARDEVAAHDGAPNQAKGATPLLAVVSVPSYDAVLSRTAKAASLFAPGMITPETGDQTLEMVKATVGLSDISWLRRDAPIRIAFASPKTYANGQLFILPITDKAKVLASLPASAQRDQGGHAGLIEASGGKIFIDFIDGFVVATQDPGLFKVARPFLGGALAAKAPEALFEARVDMDAVRGAFGGEIKGGLSELKKIYAQMLGGQAVPGLTQAIALEVEMISTFIDETDSITLKLDANGEELSYAATATPKAGTSLAKIFAILDGRSSTLAAAAPKESWLGVTTNMDLRGVQAMREIQAMVVGIYTEMLQLDAGAKAQLDKLIADLMEQSTGDSMMALTVEGKNPFALRSLSTVVDTTKTRDLYAALFDFAIAQGLALGKRQAGDDLPPELAKIQTISDLLAFIAPMAAQAGLKITPATGDKGGAKYDALTLKIDWSKIPTEGDDGGVKLAQSIIGDTIGVALGYADGKVAMSFGAHPVDDVIALVKGSYPGGEPALTSATEGAAMAMTLRVGALLDALAGIIPNLAPLSDRLAALPKDQAFAFTIKGDGGQMTMRLSAPIELIAKLATLNF